MPLNKLENFIKNTEGRILYVNPNDLDSTDAIDNQGNSLTKPFKTIQRALIESARFSYVAGNDNDLVERTTILLFPGNHIVDNRPGFAIRNDSGVAKAVSPSGSATGATNTFTLTLNSNFDLTQEDNILYKFNSVNGGVVVPRGTSIVGLDLRKTKIRPLYVPNPTDDNVRQSAIFRITGACYFWQFTFFDADESDIVYTDPVDFSSNNQSKPTFSHHKITCFEYADGITTLPQFSDLTDLDIYYSKLTNAFNVASGRDINQKYPSAPKGFSPQRPEFEIVGAFATDPLNITGIESGDGATPGQVVTVTTQIPHNLTGGTPIKIRGINVADYNISVKVAGVVDSTRFTYLLPFVRPNLPAGSAGGLSSANGQVLVETDTVTGASPYIFNTSLRSVYGMQGMHADGKKADGFRSMVVAQFTAVSLQKDDRAFVKYDKTNRIYSGIAYSKQTGSLLSSESSSTNPNTVFHLDQEANYRRGWRTTHIKVSNDSVVQIVSVFAIGFHSHFNMINGADASITNSNSNFGTFSLAAEGFKKEAFTKDDKGFISSIITPRSVVTSDQKIEYLQLRNEVGQSSSTKLFFFGQESETVPPSHIAQGFRIGAKVDEKIFVDAVSNATTYEATIVMHQPSSGNETTSQKTYEATHSDASAPKKSIFSVIGGHNLSNGESIRIIADNGDLPENIDPHTVYFAITNAEDAELGSGEIRIASSKTNADLDIPIYINTVANPTDKFKIISRVSDKKPGDAGHPIQYQTSGGWFINTLASGNTIHTALVAGNIQSDQDISYILRKDDDRSLDEKIYKLRYIVPKELKNGRDPTDGFVIQDSSSTTVLSNSDFAKATITSADYGFDRNTRFISQASFDSSVNRVTIRSDKPHNVNVGDQIVIKNIQSSTNSTGVNDKGYNGTFLVTDIVNDKQFKYSNTDTEGITHTVGTFVNNTQTRSTLTPRFIRNDGKGNFFVYRTEIVSPYIEGVQDGIYHLFVLNASNVMNESSNEFTEFKHNQNIVNLFPEYDRDNIDANPPEATTFAKRFPLGDVVTNDLKKSITRETTNKFLNSFDATKTISSVTNNNTNAIINLTEEHGFNSLKFARNSDITSGTGHVNGTYYNVKLFNNNASPSTAVWDGATADIVVSGGAVTGISRIVDGGSGYTNNEELFFDTSPVAEGGTGGSSINAKVDIKTAGISSATGNYIQITGITTGTDSYHRITAVNSTKQITVAKSTAETILNGQQIIDLGPWVAVASLGSVETDGTQKFTTTKGHGLVVGNKFRVLNSSDSNLGDYIVASVPSVTEFTAKTTTTGLSSPRYILKHGLSDNEALSSKEGENLGVRGLSVFDHETLFLTSNVNSSTSAIPVQLPDLATGTSFGQSKNVDVILSRFPLGSYIQIDGEIMRISSNTLSGNSLSVIRGALGTISGSHNNGSKVKKIKPLPIELRRPSILRASGHTFEYVGYGPGNYSTALPQLQNRSLTEREEFLTQSQETSCGNVVYTGMNDKGDFYIGNTKIASASGQQTTFDIPIPTITGEDPSRLSVVFDEVIVKERLLVEGGTSKQILSQFDGPVTFNENVRLSNSSKKLTVTGTSDLNAVNISGQLNANNTTESSSTSTGSVVVDGGVGIKKNVYLGGNVVGDNATEISGLKKVTASFADNEGFFGNGAGLTNTGALLSAASGTQKIVVTSETAGNPMITAGIDNDTLTFNATSNTLSCTNIVGNLTGDVTGDLTGTAQFATDVVGAANRVLYNSGTNDTVTSANLEFDGTRLKGTDLEIQVRDNKKVIFGNNDDMFILHDNANGEITNNKGSITIKAEDTNGKGVFIKHGNNHIAKFEKHTTNGNAFFELFHGSVFAIRGESGLDGQPNGIEVNGQLRCGGDITAFISDERLKTNMKPLDNALDKVLSLNGFTYNFNTTAKSLGYSTDGTHVGVSAQQVQAVLPEAVAPAPKSDEYLTVKYEKLVPLLIEAVKELSDKVSDLEKQINN